MLKLIGITGIVISCGLFGISRTNILKSRINILEDYYEMIINLKTQISYFKEPLPDLVDKLSKNNSSKAYLVLKGVGTDIYENDCYSSDFWAKNLKDIYHNTAITDSDLEIMSYVGEFIGQTDYINHLQHFEYVENKLIKQINIAKETYIQKGPMYNKIGFFVGAIIGVMFI